MQGNLIWKPMTKYVEFVFEDGVIRPAQQQHHQEENAGNSSAKKNGKNSGEPEQSQSISYQPSHEIVDFENNDTKFSTPKISTDGNFMVDQQTKGLIIANNSTLPSINIQAQFQGQESQPGERNSRKKMYVELLLAEKSLNCSEYDKYRVIKSAILNSKRFSISSNESINFRNKRINHVSNPDKPTRLIVLIYEQKETERNYHSVMISDEISVIDEQKILIADSADSLRVYFEQVLDNFLEKTSHQGAKISTLETKYKIMEEIGTFENYLTKKNKKIWNIIYAAYKYSHIVDLYFLAGQTLDKKEQFKNLWKSVFEQLKNYNSSEPSPRVCNYLNPEAKFILKINASLRQVRFFTKLNLTKMLSIVSTDTEIEGLSDKWTKFDSVQEMKEVYLKIQNQLQIKPQFQNPTVFLKPVTSPQIQQVESLGNTGSKKPHPHHHKVQDQDFNQEEAEQEDDDVEYQGESSENYSLSHRRRGRRMLPKKLMDKKHSSGNYMRENKYPTRTRNKNKDDSEEDDKRATIARKNREKEMNAKQPPQANMPFRILNPSQAAQMKDFSDGKGGQMAGKMGENMMGMMMPMPMSMPMMKKPQDGKPGQPNQSGKPGGPTPMMMPMSMGQMPGMGGQMMPMMFPMDGKSGAGQMMGMPGMPNGMPMMMSGMPGMPMMIPGMPGMMPPGMQPPASEDKKDKKDDSKGSQQEMPKMMGMGADFSKMMGGMGGMPIMMGGMPQGMQMMGMMPQGSGNNPMMMMMNPQQQGQSKDGKEENNNKPMGMMMNPMMNPMMQGQMNPQMMQQMMMQQAMMQMQQQQQSQTNSSNNESTQNSSQPMMMMGGFPMQGMQGMQGMPGMQGMMGSQQSTQPQPPQQGQPMMPGMQQGMPIMITQEMQTQMARMTPQQQQQYLMYKMAGSNGQMGFYGKPQDPKDSKK